MKWITNRRVRSLQKQLADAQSEIDKRDRTIAVMQAEIDSLAAVIARDRERIKAEAAQHAACRATCEGNTK